MCEKCKEKETFSLLCRKKTGHVPSRDQRGAETQTRLATLISHL